MANCIVYWAGTTTGFAPLLFHLIQQAAPLKAKPLSPHAPCVFLRLDSESVSYPRLDHSRSLAGELGPRLIQSSVLVEWGRSAPTLRMPS